MIDLSFQVPLSMRAISQIKSSIFSHVHVYIYIQYIVIKYIYMSIYTVGVCRSRMRLVSTLDNFEVQGEAAIFLMTSP